MEALDGKISVAIIAKDEEKLLGDCLESVQGFDEIIVVDTGSTDDTRGIAETRGATVYNFIWNDNFAEARNFARARCTGEWILSIDADCYLRTEEHVAYESIEKYRDKKALDVRINSDYGNFYYNFPLLTRNIPSIFYKGAVHNYLNIRRGEADSGLQISERRSPAHEKDPERTYRILTKELERDPTLVREKYYLARELVYRAQYMQAVSLLNKHITECTFKPELAESHLLLAKLLRVTSERLQCKLHARLACSINPNFKEAWEFSAMMADDDCSRQKYIKMAENATNEDVLFVRKKPWLIQTD